MDRWERYEQDYAQSSSYKTDQIAYNSTLEGEEDSISRTFIEEIFHCSLPFAAFGGLPEEMRRVQNRDFFPLEPDLEPGSEEDLEEEALAEMAEMNSAKNAAR